MFHSSKSGMYIYTHTDIHTFIHIYLYIHMYMYAYYSAYFVYYFYQFIKYFRIQHIFEIRWQFVSDPLEKSKKDLLLNRRKTYFRVLSWFSSRKLSEQVFNRWELTECGQSSSLEWRCVAWKERVHNCRKRTEEHWAEFLKIALNFLLFFFLFLHDV